VVRGVLWAALFTSLVVALSAFARPAFAMPAGFCDDRGASAIAPAPALQGPDQAFRRAPASCVNDELSAFASVQRAHRCGSGPSVGPAHALIPVRLVVAPARTESIELSFAPASPHRGVRWRVERPPRD